MRVHRWIACAAVVMHCKATGGRALSAPGVRVSSLTVTCPTFGGGGAVPVDFTCDGADRSPQLTLSAPPPETRTLAVVVEDPDAPGGTFTHWIAYNLPPDTLAIPEGVDPAILGGMSGTNDFARTGYAGPCPPKFEAHRYRFRVLALDAPLNPEPPATRDTFMAAVSGHLLGEGTLVGTYAR